MIFKKNIFLFLILILFLFFSLSLQNKLQPPFHDESYFVNLAYNITGLDKSHLNLVDNSLNLINSGPIYPTILAVSFKIFGLSMFAAKLPSIIASLFSLVIFYKLTKSLLFTFVFSTDYFFLLSSRIIRPESLVLLFTLLSFYFYLHKKNVFLSGLFASLAFLTHVYLGLIPIITIGILTIFSKKNYQFFLPIIALSVPWFLYLFTQNGDFTNITNLNSKRIIPSFYTIKLAPIFAISFFLLLSSKKSPHKRFLVILFIISSAIVFYGSSTWYLPFISLSAILCLFYSNKKIIITALILINLCVQLNFLHTKTNTYEILGRQVSQNLDQNSKVFLFDSYPDIYIYLIEKRPDLKIFKLPYFATPEGYKDTLSKANYAITSNSATAKYISEQNSKSIFSSPEITLFSINP